jgi:K+-transporting ATPase c subunit
MKRHLVTACLYTAITAVLLGIVYPLVITGSAHLAFPAQAFGELVRQNGVVIGSRHCALWSQHISPGESLAFSVSRGSTCSS